MSRRSLTVLAGTLSAAAAATALCVAPAANAANPGPSGPSSPSTGPLAVDSGDSVAEMSAQWLATEEGLSLETARDRVAAQEGLSRTATSLETSLGAKAVGTWIDQATGVLHVNVTDAAAASTVRSAGASARVVSADKSRLAASEKAATTVAGKDTIASYVDPVTNKVILTVPADRVEATRAKIADPSVTVEGTQAKVSTQANVYGGQQIEFSGYVCSLGFNATKAGAPVFITAGHCGEGYQTFSKNGTTLGKTQAFSFPGNDYAYSTLASSWTGIGAVDLWTGSARAVTGSSNAAVGTAICKSGRTTYWTCGSVQAKNVTVNYDNGDGTTSSVSGLTKSNTCTEGGDSGGSWMAGNLAQGVTSGGAGYGSSGVCGEKVGQPNIAYFQPVGEILSAYGLTLKTA
ncbi:putative secreted serine protease [Janibacter sp. HTCC2649]|uniref:S1 family peptidase n=1 Tax=Janibacter sp. HTCC2649 TaxID=313589 RepID=UPI000067098B|nr:S1 family peptidase [Janibacter sp. HTCC2649]EAQ00897.1 putative secreted serine protease [Janibacter sp. HTCC2649]